MKNVMVAMSGGVDSTVSALLLQQNYNVSGTCMRLYNNSTEDARIACEKMNIPFKELDFSSQFKTDVIDYFVDAYNNAITPNPCLICNHLIKFGLLLDEALACDADFLATGHYAKVEKDANTGRFLLKKAADTAKDQTYFLYSLSQHVLSHLILPLGDLTKSHIREVAASYGLSNAEKPDSQDICFVSDNYSKFIESYSDRKSLIGDFIDIDGNILGKHKGIIHYTIGQRKGLGLSFSEPMYVLNKDNGNVTLGKESLLYHQRLIVTDLNFISIDTLNRPMKVEAKIRYTRSGSEATIYPQDDTVCVEFTVPQRAISIGQACVFYSGDTVVGGGIIAEILQ